MTLSTRAEIRQAALLQADGFVRAVTAVGTTTTLVSANMQYAFGGDDVKGTGMYIYDPAEALIDRLRVANSWDDSTGTATIDAIVAAKAGTETVEYTLRGDPDPTKFNDAINTTLQESDRSVFTVIPTVEGEREYEFLNAPWIETRSDILSVRKRESPNIIDNSSFELWGRGIDEQLHAWVLSGTAATVTRVNGTYGRFAARVTRAGTDAVLSQTIPIPIIQLYGKSISVFARIKSGTAAVASIRINDGTDTTSTSDHDGGGDWDEFTATHTVNADAVGPLVIECRVDTTDTNADFEMVVAVEGSTVPTWLSKYGDQHATQSDISYVPTMDGSLPVIITADTFSRGAQLVVQSRQKYFKLTAESGVGGVTDMPLDAVVAGTIVNLAKIQAAGSPNAAKWKNLGQIWEPKYLALRRASVEPSLNPTRSRNVIGPA